MIQRTTIPPRDPQTTDLTVGYHSLGVEWVTSSMGTYTFLPNGDSRELNPLRVSLFRPPSGLWQDERTSILKLDPRAALRLRDWLNTQGDFLDILAALCEEEERAEKHDENEKEKKECPA